MKTFPLKLFTESGQYTEEALQLDGETAQALLPIFEKWIDLGFNPRAISHIMNHALFDVELDVVLDIELTKNGAPNNEQEKTTS